MNIEYIKLCKFMENNEELKNYFNRLLKTIDLKNYEENKIILENLQELGKNYDDNSNYIEELKIELELSGIIISDDTVVYPEGYIAKYEEDSKDAFDKYGHYSFRHNDEMCMYHDYEWPNIERVGFSTTFNGIEVNKVVLEDEKVNHTSKNNYEVWLKNNPNLVEELKETEIEINKDLELLDKKIFGKKRIKERIELNKTKLLRLNEKKLRGDYLKSRNDFFENLDDTTRNNILEYLNSIEKCNNLSKKIKNNICSMSKSCEDSMINNVDELVEEALRFGLVTPEEVEKYNYILMNIDTSNVIVSDAYVKEHNSGSRSWYGNKVIERLIDNYGKKIMELKQEKDFNDLKQKVMQKNS